jgi:hypothetical protein
MLKYKEFINENNSSINWNLIEKFIEIVKGDYQFDDTNEDFCGFINMDPENSPNFAELQEFYKASLHDNDDYVKLVKMMKDKGLKIESSQKDEVIITEVDNIHLHEDPIEYLKSRKCTLTEDGWHCPIHLALDNMRSPLVLKGKFVVQLSYAKSITATKCHLTTLEGSPKKIEGYLELSAGNYISDEEIKFYTKNKGYNNYYLDLLTFMIKDFPNRLDRITWPGGFLDSNVGKSAKNIGKFNL